MSTRYRNLEWERDDDRYGRDEDRGRYYDRGLYGTRPAYGAGRDEQDYGYLGGAYGGGAYGRDSGRDYGRDYGRSSEYYGRDYGSRGYGRREPGRYEREGDFIERGYERSHRRADERDDRGGYQTDYGRTSGRFFGPEGRRYDPDDYNEGYGPVGYDRRSRRRDDDDRDDYRRGRRGRDERNWLDRAADEVRSWFGGDEDDDERRPYSSAGRYRGRGPRNYRRSDERIRDDVSDRLADNDWLDASDIEVQVVGGEVTLTGTVESRYAKRLAEDIAESVSGVTNVQNSLRVNRGWEVGMGQRAVNPDALGTPGSAGATAPTAEADDLTQTSPASRAAGGGQS